MPGGQIVLESNFGKCLYNMVLREDIKTVVEMGTYGGLGSTLCIIKGLIDKNLKNAFTSVELYPDVYAFAVNNLKQYFEYVNLLCGTIIEYEDIYWFDHNTINFEKDKHARLWHQKDLDNLKKAKNILHLLPKQIDLLLLDGGEYTTYPEYLKLRNRANIFALDDINTLKCSRIREELLDAGCTVLTEDLNDRNGWGVYEKSS